MAKMECVLAKSNNSKNINSNEEIWLTDISTDKVYRLVVESAILKLEEVEMEESCK